MIVLLLPIVLFAQGENWVYRCNGPWNAKDEAFSLVFGADSNIYTAGYSNRSNGFRDFTVISLTPVGSTNWIYKYHGTGATNIARDIVYGTDGNIYVAGYSDNVGSEWAFTVISLTVTGDTNWIYKYDGPGQDKAFSIAYGGDSNIYVAGSIWGIGTGLDFAVISLTTTGDTNWVYRYNGMGYDWDQAFSLVYGADGNIYAAGSSGGTNQDFIVISLTTTGNTNWVYRYNDTGGIYECARSIVYGADGNIYAAGATSIGDIAENTYFTVVSLTTAGDTNWIYRYSGTGNGTNRAYSIVYGADGNIYAAGSSNQLFNSDDFTVISLTTTGNTNWIYCYDDLYGSFDEAYSLDYGTDGNIYAAGYSTNSGTGYDFMVISLTTAGDTNWVYQYNGRRDSADIANSIVCGGDGNVYAAGYSTGSRTSLDYTVISLTPDFCVKEGEIIKAKNFHGPTIFSGPLILPKDKQCKVFDITGRAVIPDRIRPGVYFIQVDGIIIQKVVKVK